MQVSTTSGERKFFSQLQHWRIRHDKMLSPATVVQDRVHLNVARNRDNSTTLKSFKLLYYNQFVVQWPVSDSWWILRGEGRGLGPCKGIVYLHLLPIRCVKILPTSQAIIIFITNFRSGADIGSKHEATLYHTMWTVSGQVLVSNLLGNLHFIKSCASIEYIHVCTFVPCPHLKRRTLPRPWWFFANLPHNLPSKLGETAAHEKVLYWLAKRLHCHAGTYRLSH